MKIRLFVAVIFLLALPMWFATSKDNTNSTPFVTIAIAGHTTAGNFCECGASGCLCDPGEEETGHSIQPDPSQTPDDDPRKPKLDPGSEIDFGAAAFLLGLALFMWSRFRG